ncbi:MAG: multi-sensor hybrid histidine kinase [Bacteroidetes bacterium]|nr:multi-sensor hybrid histidine kinase [Bacteroidota bacterium]
MSISILVVEDESIVAKDIVNRLKHLGYTVTGTVASGEEAVRAATLRPPDLVMMDIMLKGNMDGIEAARRILETLDIPVVYLTAYADEKTLHRAKVTEAFGYLLKPFEERELHITIEIALYKHQMERKLRESEQWLSATLQSVADAVIATDTQGRIRFLNPIAEVLTGWSQADAKGKPLVEVFIAADEPVRQQIALAVRNAAGGEGRTGAVVRAVLIARDGREIPVDESLAPIRNAAGETTGVVLVFRDVTERRQSEEALRQSESQLAGIVGTAMDAIVTVDEERRILLFNGAAEKMFGCAAAGAIGQVIDRFIPPRYRDAHEERMRDFASTNVSRRSMGDLGMVWGLRQDGEEFPAEASISQIEINGRKFFTVILRDITERKRMEEQLRQAQKMESIGTLASSIAHDFNNVLNNVLGFAAQLKKYIHDEAKIRKYIETIEKSAMRGADLSSQLLSFARTGRRTNIPTNLYQIVGEVIASCRETFPAKVSLESRIAPDLLPTMGDHGGLYQVLLNLCVNARDAICARPDGTGVLTIEARNAVIGKDVSSHLFAAPGSRCVELKVSDTGVGIPEQIRDRIFDPFFTTKERGRGTGLGLSIVYNIIRSHQGAILLESEPGVGSTFRVFLPAVQADPVDDLHKDRPVPQGTRKQKVLLVDDEPAMQELGRVMLEEDGYEVTIAANGLEALEIYKEDHDTIDLVVLDLVMPGMDGGQTYTEMKKIDKGLKAFFCTGFISDQIIAGLLEEEKLYAISKPFRPDEFLRTVRNVICSGNRVERT